MSIASTRTASNSTMLAPRIKLKSGCHSLYDFKCQGAEGWVTAQEERKHSQTGETIPEHIEVTFIGSRAWRSVKVYGTKSLRRAVQAAMVHAEPVPVVRMEGEQEIFGKFLSVTVA